MEEKETWISKIIKAAQQQIGLQVEGKKNEELSKGSGKRAMEAIDASLTKLKQEVNEALRKYNQNPNDKTFQEYKRIKERYQRLLDSRRKI